jgi:antitoxin (DNA-binding transcriptional repressor) of toxin-antitoxin stability system
MLPRLDNGFGAGAIAVPHHQPLAPGAGPPGNCHTELPSWGMAYPATPMPPGRPRDLPLKDVRTRIESLVRMTALSDLVTIITDAGRPLAAVVPVAAARSRADADAAAAHAQAAASGWMRRFDAVRAELRRQHAVEVRDLERELEQAWQALDRVAPPGSDRDVDALRVTRRSRT